jgi:hypothetical protein
VKAVAYDLYLNKSQELFDKDIRRNLFKLFSKWCDGEDLLLYDEQTRKRLVLFVFVPCKLIVTDYL